MIRKIIIVVLALIAFPAIALAVASFVRTFDTCTGDSPQDAKTLILVRDGWLLVVSWEPIIDERMAYPSPGDVGPPSPLRQINIVQWNIPPIIYAQNIQPVEDGFSFGDPNSSYYIAYSRGRDCNALRETFRAFWILPISLALGAYPSVAFIRGPLRRYRRRKRSLCLICGYDLRGSPDRCPECGSKIESP